MATHSSVLAWTKSLGSCGLHHFKNHIYGSKSCLSLKNYDYFIFTIEVAFENASLFANLPY